MAEERSRPSSPRIKKRWVALSLLGAGLALLWIPEAQRTVSSLPEGRPFVWDRDAYFRKLEKDFERTRQSGCPSGLADRVGGLEGKLKGLVQGATPPGGAGWEIWEAEYFDVAAHAGGCAEVVARLVALRSSMRRQVKSLARTWGSEAGARDRVYRLLYGTRLAVEELMLQSQNEELGLVRGTPEPSAAPGATIEGVRVHSGDLLVSRGGAPTSAFIARGSDYPGNFSHVALAHVDERTREVSIIESHIESGVGVFSADEYLSDKKLRILLLRLRADLPQVVEEPLLPHRVAQLAKERARSRHIPYDFSMDVQDASKQFCSEVASSNYGEKGIRLWKSPSRFSSPGLARWMAALGVEHLETHGPSDLEYDPDLTVVAEWRDPDELFFDHVDNAVIDALLEEAEEGAEFSYRYALLPAARIGKAYSWVKNELGGVGPIPEGMSATVALRADWLTKVHGTIFAAVVQEAQSFRAERGYRAPYWRLVDMARREAREALRR